jgi:hypothetical protein
MSSSIQDKTIRPGSLRGFAYYYSNRQAEPTPAPAATATKRRSKRGVLFLALLVVAGGFWLGFRGGAPKNSAASLAPAVVSASANHCQGNTQDKLIKVSVEQRKLWACEAGKTVLSSAVITGLRGHAETETPLGTYHIYAKQTNTTLKGSDSRGAWSDPVYYWMPFLDNQYGTYGFHDATWRQNSAFGHISPDSSDASHGCVELPLATSKWLYDWAPVGTTVSIET